MSELPAVAVLYEPSSASVLALAASARDVCRVVWTCDLSDPLVAAQRRALARFGEVVDLHARRGPDVTAELAGHGVRGVASFTDPPLPYAAAIAREMDLPFHAPETAALLTDKQAQRARLAEQDVPSARYVAVPRGSPVPQGFSLPAVVKPRRGAASRGVVLAADDDQVRAAAAGAGEDVLVEEYLPDLTPPARQRHRSDLLSVESVVRDGVSTLVALTQRWPLVPPFRETGSLLPAGLDRDEEGRIVDVAEQARKALGVRHGFLHTEVKRTPDGPRIVEVNGRLGGLISALHVHAGGGDLVRQVYRNALGYPLELPGPTTRVAFSLWLYAAEGVDEVHEVAGLDAVREMPGVAAVTLNLPPGAAVDPRQGGDSRVVSVEAAAPDHAAAFALRAGILRAVAIT